MTTEKTSPRRPAYYLVRGLALLALLAALLGLNVLYLGYLGREHKLFAITDFSHHGWLSGRVVLGGGNPYRAQDWLRANWTTEYERDIGWDYATGNFENRIPTRPGATYNSEARADFLYPIWMAYLFIPFAMLPLFWALALFMLLNEVALLVALWLACRVLSFRPPWYIVPILALLAFGFRPTFLALQEGAYIILVLAALLGAVVLIREGRAPWLVGALLAFSTIKLQAALLILAFTGLWLLRGRRWPEILWTAAAGCAIWILPTLLWPGWIGEWLGMVGMASPLVFAQPTIWSLWVVLLEPYWWTAGIISVALLAMGLLLVWRRDLVRGEWTSLPVTFILALPMAYYIWDYDQVLLLFPWLSCWALAAVGDGGSARAWRYVLIAWVLILPLYALLPIPRGEQQTYGLLLPASLLLLYGLARRQAEKATRAHTTAGHHQAVARGQAGGVS